MLQHNHLLLDDPFKTKEISDVAFEIKTVFFNTGGKPDFSELIEKWGSQDLPGEQWLRFHASSAGGHRFDLW